MQFLPPGTTWLDIVTLVIAIAGFGLALRRYRGDTKVGVRVEVGVVDDLVAIVLTNTERRVVTVTRAALTVAQNDRGKVFERWHEVNVRRSAFGMPASDPALPTMLEVGGTPRGVLAGLRSVKAAFHPDVPSWAFAVDAYQNTYWGKVPDEVKAAIRATKRRITGPDDEYGQPTAIEVEDDAAVEPSALFD